MPITLGLDPALACLLLLAGAAESYLLLALWQVWRFSPDETPAAHLPPISVLKPLCGAEPGLARCLRSFYEQAYPEFELVFGVASTTDPANAIVQTLSAAFPQVPTRLVVDGRVHGSNLKVSNLMNMLDRCSHDLLVIADSDVLAAPDALEDLARRCVDERVGAVSCLYQGEPVGGVPSRLGALFINDWFIPSVLVDIAINGVDGCFGAMIAVKRKALDAIGGLPVLANHLAEDNLMGRLLQKAGFGVGLSRRPVTSLVGESDLLSLFCRELRWGRTVRACRRFDQFASVVTCPLPLLLVFLALRPCLVSLAVVGLHVGLRMALHGLMLRRFDLARVSAWLVPLREVLCFVVWLASLTGDRITWRAQDFRVTPTGGLVPVQSEPGVCALLLRNELVRSSKANRTQPPRAFRN